MDKSCHSSGESTAATTSSNNTSSNNSNNSNSSRGDQYLRHLNKISHRISKPILRTNSFDHTLLHRHRPPQPPSSESPSLNQHQTALDPPPHQHQPPVYNINKCDFRDVVQKLTGSPAHDRFATPQPPIQPPKPSSSRLQRIRPPPLAAVATNPNTPSYRQLAPLSPLPPFPSVHGAVESPISAYMRYFQSSIRAPAADYDTKQPSRLQIQPPLSLQNQMPPPPPSIYQSSSSIAPSQSLMPASFGCLPSPRSMFLLGQLGFPTSPRLPVPSPRCRDVE